MKGNELLSRALVLLGRDGGIDDSLAVRGANVINQILLDLKLSPLERLSSDAGLSPAQEDAVCYGAAMLLSVTEGDTGRNAFLTQAYSAKRAAALAKTERVSDCLPTVTEGG